MSASMSDVWLEMTPICVIDASGAVVRAPASGQNTPESIDLVVLSHGHLDRIGGFATKSGEPAFVIALSMTIVKDIVYQC